MSLLWGTHEAPRPSWAYVNGGPVAGLNAWTAADGCCPNGAPRVVVTDRRTGEVRLLCVPCADAAQFAWDRATYAEHAQRLRYVKRRGLFEGGA